MSAQRLAAAIVHSAVTEFLQGGSPVVAYLAGEFLLERSDAVVDLWFACAGVDMVSYRERVRRSNPEWFARLARLRAAVHDRDDHRRDTASKQLALARQAMRRMKKEAEQRDRDLRKADRVSRREARERQLVAFFGR